MLLKPYFKMLLYFKFFPEKHKSKEEYIDRILNRWMLFYFTPRPFHLFAPVDIIKNKNGCITCFIQKLVKVTHCRFIPVITIYICQVNYIFIFQNAG